MTTRGRVLRSHTRTNRSARFNQLLELTTALSSEADKDTKEKVETAEILSLLGLAGRKIEPARGQSQQPAAALQQQGHLPLPAIHHAAPAAQQPQQPLHQQQAIRPAVAKLPVKPAVMPVTPSSAVVNPVPKGAPKPLEGEKKRKRSKTTPEQLRILMDEFQREPMPNATTRQTLATRLGMTPRSVQIWFQNMRAKVKKASSTTGSAPGEGKKTTGAPHTDAASHDSDGPARKRQRVVTGEEDCENGNKMELEQQQQQGRRSSVIGASSVVIPSVTKQLPNTSANAAKSSTQQPQPVKIAASPQSAFAPANATAAANGPKARTTEHQTSVTGKLPLPPIQHAGQPIFGVPLQYIPQSYHCDQLKRAMPAIAALTGSSVQQMTA